MRLVFLNDKQIGKVLVNPIYTKGGIMFVKGGTTLTERILVKLKEIGIVTAYVEDENTDIILEEVIPSQLKMEILSEIKTFFENIRRQKWVDDKQLSDIRKKILENIDISENAICINNCVDNDKLSELALHTLDVVIYTAKIATYREFPSAKIETIITSALLHDIGKLFEQTEKPHNQYAFELIKENAHFGPTVFVPVLHLHERVNGKGQFNVNGDKIYENSHILHISNNYANLLHKEMLPYEIIENISSDALEKFDEDIFKDSLNAFYSYPNGIAVILNDGTKGVVSKQNKGFPTRPMISIYIASRCRLIDLTKNLTTFIEKVDLGA